MDRLFGFGKKQSSVLLAVCNGKIENIERAEDDVFSQKILGDGFSQIPESGIMRSPAAGVVSQVYDTYHAYCIESTDGAQVLVHIGIDTVNLKGEGFKPRVKSGDTVRAGAPIAEVDLAFLKEKGFNTRVMTVITNMDDIKHMSIHEGMAEGGATPALTYTISKR